jgi:hypothetical protein
MRFLVCATILCASCAPGLCQNSPPSWFKNAKEFCAELAKRTNAKGTPVPIGKPKSTQFADYATHPIASPRSSEAIIGKYDWTDKEAFAREVKSEASKGPDFAGRYALVRWSCGSWCSNAVIADVVTGRTRETPFVGVVGCQEVTKDFDTVQRQASSSLLIVRGSLEMAFDHSFDEGPCGTFYFRWNVDRLRLIGCEINNENSN